MKKILLFLWCTLIVSMIQGQTVSDVNYERNGKELRIWYNLDRSCDIRVRVSVDSGANFSYPLQNVSGDVGKGVKPGKREIIAYDLYELRGVAEDTALVKFSVEVDDGSVEILVGNLVVPMVFVEGGTFTMGGQKVGGYTYEEDLPKHKVTVNDFYICKYEVTQDLWEAVMDTNPSHWNGNGRLPVEQVSWNEVQIFISRLSQLTGHRFRLPTEAEWEYAARGGSAGKSHNGYPGGEKEAGEYCWYCVNSHGHTHPVGEKKPNELGLYDMGGNVMEWCSDWQTAYSAEPQDNPKGPKHGENKVLRGGCINSPSWGCTVGHRSWYMPEYGYDYTGFRLVVESMIVEEGD